MAVKSEWLHHHNELLGRLAATQESLQSIHAGAPLESVEESLEDLQRSIDEADEEQELDDEEEASGEEEEDEGDDEE